MVYGTSRWQGLAHHAACKPPDSLPRAFESPENFDLFWLCPAKPAPVAVKPLISRKFCAKLAGAFSRLSGGSTPPNLRFLKKNRNVFCVGTLLRPKLQLRIGEHLGTFDGTLINLQEKLIKSPEKNVSDTNHHEEHGASLPARGISGAHLVLKHRRSAARAG